MSAALSMLIGGGALVAYLYARERRGPAVGTKPAGEHPPPPDTAATTGAKPADERPAVAATAASAGTEPSHEAAAAAAPAAPTGASSSTTSSGAEPTLPGRWIWPVEVIRGARVAIARRWDPSGTAPHRGVDLRFPVAAPPRHLTYPALVERWRPLVAAYAGKLDIDVLLTWILHESGGNPCSVGMRGIEAGLFQTYHPDNDRFGATFAQLRAPCDGATQQLRRALTATEERIQVSSGVRLVRACWQGANAALAKIGATWSLPDRYCLTKLVHGLPGYVGPFLGAFVAKSHRPPAGWAEFRAWVRALSPTAVVRINQAVAPWASIEERDRLFGSAERTGQAASREAPSFTMPAYVRALAASDGRVWSAAWTPRGFAIVLDHAPGLRTHYAHLASLLVAPTMRGVSQQRVSAGQPIGIIGADPQDPAGERHLHFELWRGDSAATATNPEPFMGRWEHLALGAPLAASRNAAAGGHRNARRSSLVYRSVGRRGEPYPAWVRALDGRSGVYVIRDVSTGSPEIVYVGESHARCLYATLTRHFQSWHRAKTFWRDQFSQSHDPGLTYDRNHVDVAVRITSDAAALDEEARLIRLLRPRDNLLGQPEEDIPF